MIYSTNVCAVLLAGAALAQGKIYFQEKFNDAAWEQRWTVPSDWKAAADVGAWGWTAGKNFADATDKGIQTSEDVSSLRE
jgi:hypothetical protein